MGTRLTPVAVDIETTGFDADDRVTVVGFALPLGCRVLVNRAAGPLDSSRLESRLGERFGATLEVTGHADEAALLEAVAAFLEASVAPRAYLLVALAPFADSAEAVSAFRAGDFESLVAHNVADIRRTRALSSLAQRFCGTSAFSLKSLTPASRGPSLSGPNYRLETALAPLPARSRTVTDRIDEPCRFALAAYSVVSTMAAATSTR
jgi:hypothetical protein